MTEKTLTQNMSNDFEFPISVREEHIAFLKRIVDHLKDKDEDNYLLMVEKLLYLVLEYLSVNSPQTLSFDYLNEFNRYLEIMNKKSVEAFNKGQIDEASKVIARAVDLLNQKNISQVYTNQLKLFETKILTYNNLSCIYRKLGKFTLAIKVISFALDFEEKLAAEDYGTSKISIISTYLNKAAILSQVAKHEEAQQIISQALEKLTGFNDKDQGQAEKAHIQYLKMSAFYSLAVESEHLDQSDKAISNYESAGEYAKELGRQQVMIKVEKALNNLRGVI